MFPQLLPQVCSFSRVAQKLREALYFYYKGYKSRSTKWMRGIGYRVRYGGSKELLCPLQVWHISSISVHSSTWKNTEPHHLEVFIEVSLSNHCWLNHWPLQIMQSPAPLSSLVVTGWGWKFQLSNRVLLCSGWWPAPILKIVRNLLAELTY